MTPDALARAGLALLVEPGSWPVHQAVAQYGAEHVFALLRQGRAVGPITPRVAAGAARRAQGADPAVELARLHTTGGRLLCPGDVEWPRGLRWRADQLEDAPPLALWVRGAADLGASTELAVGVVGSRAASRYGKDVAAELGAGLAARGATVVSGAAYGIDGAAHRGALAEADAVGAAPTVAVLACGVDRAYPPGHARLLAAVLERGAVVSEVPCGWHPTRGRFLVRNRLIAALTGGTVVVEATARSGSNSTAARARDLERHLMAVPGPITSPTSVTPHRLLRAGAHCVTSALEVLELVAPAGQFLLAPQQEQVRRRDTLSRDARAVLDALPVRGGAGEAALARSSGLSPLLVQQVLPPLAVAGLVERSEQGWRLSALGAGR